ncbi:hypothetical protein MBLNU457_4378t2 [Dothideomycetes sp. NU457]
MKATMLWQSAAALLFGLTSIASAAGEQWTMKHEAGRCAMRGQCGKQGFFGGDLPCPDNGLAEAPSPDVRKRLVAICGDKWSEGDVCCNGDQLDVLDSNLKRAEQLISACPACKENFFNLFCTFTCSPDQSTFVNVTQIAPKGDKFLVTELDQLLSVEFTSGFFDSCKDVKFGATGGRAMDLIGGGAKNYSQFVKFLGDKKPFGSPFQINFPASDEDTFPGMHEKNEKAHPCNSTDDRYRCACVDCASACPALPEVAESKECRVGLLPCLSFAIILIYSIFIALLILAVSGHIVYAKHNKSKNERLRLLQDSSPSDDEDEGDIVRHAGSLDKPQKAYFINTICDRAFSRLGRTCAHFPAITVSSCVVVVALLSLGWMRFELETNPVRWWVAPNSAAAQEKEFFDNNFGPFFRTEQAFLVNDTNPSGPGPVLSYETLQWWFDVEMRVQRLKSPGGYTLDDVCYKPTGDACVVQSVTGYFGGADGGAGEDWAATIKDCTGNPGDVQCLPPFQQPIAPKYILGPYNTSVLDTNALIVTWVVSNADEGSAEEKRAMDWEHSLRDLLLAVKGEARERGLRLSLNTEASLEEELNKSNNSDAKIIAISYLIMFLYASISLGSTTISFRSLLRNPTSALVQSKFMLGVAGIIIVLMSVSASVGLFAACGVKATLIIAEVIPFLVLAVGVDNIFLIVHEFERVNISHADESVEDRIGRSLGRMGPSILLSATTETVAFALGAAVGMPAVKSFAVYAAGAVFINAILQVTMFISVLTWNQQRVEAGRADCIPCVKVSRPDSTTSFDGYGSAPFTGVEDEGPLQRFIRRTYAPSLLGTRSKVAIITIFLGIFTIGLALLPTVELGLDQRIAVPSDSYLIKYFDDLYDYFEGGPPVYFVTRDLNVTARQHQQELCGRFSTCHEFSMANVLEQERKRPEVSYIADATASWIDDFFFWLNPSFDCCMDKGKPCFEDRNPPWNVTLSGMPEGEEFVSYLSRWIASPTTEDCPLGGKAPYSNALVIDNSSLTIPASHFRTAHVALHSQADFINAYKSARRIADDISARQNISVFPYSKFYIFFDQYLSIVQLSGGLLGGALGFILVLCSLLLGSIATGLVVTVTVAMTLVAIIGTMALAGVSLNALVLVNLIICVGISVEFCAHIARAFSVPSSSLLERTHLRGRDARAFAALVNVGGSVFSGIGITKLLGIIVLAFTKSKIFEVYYFRVWLALVIWAALHALVLLPVLLSWFGGPGYVDPESDGSLEQDLASRRYRALVPDEEYDSEDF